MRPSFVGGKLSAVLAAAVLGTFVASVRVDAATGDCGQPQSIGDGPKTADALATLKKAVGTPSACDAKPCICDVNGNGMVQTSDALRVLQAAVGQSVELACACVEECTLLDSGASLVSAGDALLQVPPQQVEIQVRLIVIHKQSFDDLGLDFDQSVTVTTDAGPPSGGTNGTDTTLAVDSDVSGGPLNLDYLMYDMHRAGGALPILNKNFVSPFMDVKTFPLLPTDGCVVFGQADAVEPQSFPGGDPVENLSPMDAGYGGSDVFYNNLAEDDLDDLISLIKGDDRNSFLFAPLARLYSGQQVLHMIDDVEPTLSQVVEDFRSRIQDVTNAPFGVFTGPTVDLTPRIGLGGNVDVDLRMGSQAASFFFSTAFMVNGTSVDAEIPLHRRSRNKATFTIPAGQNLVIGGMKRMGQDADGGLPVLGDIPLIGSLFTHKLLDPSSENLIIVITPAIVGGE